MIVRSSGLKPATQILIRGCRDCAAPTVRTNTANAPPLPVSRQLSKSGRTVRVGFPMQVFAHLRGTFGNAGRAHARHSVDSSPVYAIVNTHIGVEWMLSRVRIGGTLRSYGRLFRLGRTNLPRLAWIITSAHNLLGHHRV